MCMFVVMVMLHPIKKQDLKIMQQNCTYEGFSISGA